RVIDIVEKPKPEEAPSKLGDAGIHVFEPVIFDAISRIKPSVRNEYQLTDAIKMLVKAGRTVVFKKIHLHIDVGTLRDWWKTLHLIDYM
ncbi:MAG TPA: nucleotidyl transferase, partial [Desulfobacteraceae bacterium]|nr:nucleotidyl transferase [Desulfobacteraceae bacterium]